MLQVGDTVPEFSRPSTTGSPLSKADLAGRWAVIYFFPWAFTPTCTREATFFQNNAPELARLGASVVGVSLDPLPRQCDFARSVGATYPLLADEDRLMSRAFGVLWPVLPVIRRVTFVVDPRGVVRGVFHHEHQLIKAFDPVLRFLRAATAAAGLPMTPA